MSRLPKEHNKRLESYISAHLISIQTEERVSLFQDSLNYKVLSEAVSAFMAAPCCGSVQDNRKDEIEEYCEK